MFEVQHFPLNPALCVLTPNPSCPMDLAQLTNSAVPRNASKRGMPTARCQLPRHPGRGTRAHKCQKRPLPFDHDQQRQRVQPHWPHRHVG